MTAPHGEDPPRVRLGVSACLLGQEVRFDGGHKRNPYLLKELGRWVEWVPVCPEVEVGMGVPRESVRHVRAGDDVRVVAPRSGTDWTDKLRAWSAERADQLADLDLDGFVLKKDSPTCGLFRVRIYSEKGGSPTKDGVGVFAAALTGRLASLPVEEEGRLNDPRLRENFADRIFTQARFRHLLAERPTPSGLVDFHTRHKCTVLAHHPGLYRELGRIVAEAGSAPWDELVQRYGETLARAMSHLAGPGRHANVLEHLAGHLKVTVPGEERRELNELIHSHRRGLVPLVVPLTLLRHHFRRHSGAAWAKSQIYLDPYPEQLMLRNRV